MTRGPVTVPLVEDVPVWVPGCVVLVVVVVQELKTRLTTMTVSKKNKKFFLIFLFLSGL